MLYKITTKICLALLFIQLLSNISLADGGMRKPQKPAPNIYGVEKDVLEKSFGDRGKTIDDSDFSRGKESAQKKAKQRSEDSDVPNFDNLTVSTEDAPIVLPQLNSKEEADKWQEF